MKYKKGLLAFCLIMAVFVCISGAAASDANDTATAGSDNINENAIAIEDNSEDVLNTDENPIEASDDDDAVVSESLITPYVSEISTDIEYDTGHAIFKLTDYYTDEPLEYVEVVMSFQCPGGLSQTSAWTDEDGIVEFGYYDLTYIDEEYNEGEMPSGTYTVELSVDDYSISDEPYYTSITVTGVPVYDPMTTVTITPAALSTSYQSGAYFKAKVTDSKTREVLEGVEVILKVYTGKNAKTVTLTSDANGIVKYSSSKLSLGTHKVVLDVKKSEYYSGKSVTSSIKITKGVLKISAPKVTRYYKKAGKFKVTVKNKASGKAVKGLKVIIKVYTGKKAKKIVRKTNSKGQVSFSTKSLSKGKHKIMITVKKTSKYKKASAKSSVKIVKKTKKSSGKKSSSSSSGSGSYILRYYAFTSASANPYSSSIYAPQSYAPQYYSTPSYGYY